MAGIAVTLSQKSQGTQGTLCRGTMTPKQLEKAGLEPRFNFVLITLFPSFRSRSSNSNTHNINVSFNLSNNSRNVSIRLKKWLINKEGITS